MIFATPQLEAANQNPNHYVLWSFRSMNSKPTLGFYCHWWPDSVAIMVYRVGEATTVAAATLGSWFFQLLLVR